MPTKLAEKVHHGAPFPGELHNVVLDAGWSWSPAVWIDIESTVTLGEGSTVNVQMIEYRPLERTCKRFDDGFLNP